MDINGATNRGRLRPRLHHLMVLSTIDMKIAIVYKDTKIIHITIIQCLLQITLLLKSMK